MTQTSSTLVDFGHTAADYAQHRQGFPPEFFRRLAHFDIGRAGQRILDVGTGTGLLARAFALRGCRVTGLDRSADLLRAADRLTAAEGLSIDYREGQAEATGLQDASFDIVSAATCWHWFDRKAAAAEALRLLAPGGRLLIAHLDGATNPRGVGALSWRLAYEFNPTPHRGDHTFRFPEWADDLMRAGFTGYEVFAFTTTLHYSFESWCGRVRASHLIGASLPQERVAEFDARHRRELAERFGTGMLAVEHRLFALIARRA